MQLVFRDSAEVARLLDAYLYIDRAAVGHCLVCLAKQGSIDGIEEVVPAKMNAVVVGSLKLPTKRANVCAAILSSELKVAWPLVPANLATTVVKNVTILRSVLERQMKASR